MWHLFHLKQCWINNQLCTSFVAFAYRFCFTLHMPLIMSTLHVPLEFDLLIMFTALHVTLGTHLSNEWQLCIFMFTIIILTCLYDLWLQRDTMPWCMTLTGHTLMSQSESEWKKHAHYRYRLSWLVTDRTSPIPVITAEHINLNLTG